MKTRSLLVLGLVFSAVLAGCNPCQDATEAKNELVKIRMALLDVGSTPDKTNSSCAKLKHSVGKLWALEDKAKMYAEIVISPRGCGDVNAHTEECKENVKLSKDLEDLAKNFDVLSIGLNEVCSGGGSLSSLRDRAVKLAYGDLTAVTEKVSALGLLIALEKDILPVACKNEPEYKNKVDSPKSQTPKLSDAEKKNVKKENPENPYEDEKNPTDAKKGQSKTCAQ